MVSSRIASMGTALKPPERAITEWKAAFRAAPGRSNAPDRGRVADLERQGCQHAGGQQHGGAQQGELGVQRPAPGAAPFLAQVVSTGRPMPPSTTPSMIGPSTAGSVAKRAMPSG